MSAKKPIIPIFTIAINYPWAFAVLLIPMLISIATGCYLWKPDFFFCLILFICPWIMLLIIDSWTSDKVVLMQGTYSRKEVPFGCWFHMLILIVAYVLFALCGPILFAFQELGK